MGKPKKNNVSKQQEAQTEKLNRLQTRTQSMAMRRNRGNFRNLNNFSRRSEDYWSYGSYYGSYSWARGSLSSNPRTYSRPYKKAPSRPVSPVLGSEEYMVRKIQQTSAIIMKQLLNPNEQITSSDSQTLGRNKGESSKSAYEQKTKICEKPVETASNKNKTKKINNYNIEEIQKKIMNHITNLNDGRKKNLINSQNMSVYDAAIQQIQKQKRLEISRALRHMCSKSNETQESSDFINSIIPDMGIKIEDLPRNLIEELRNTLILDFNGGIFEDAGYDPVGETQIGNALNTNDFSMNKEPIPDAVPKIKPEPVDENESRVFTEDSEHNQIRETDGQKSPDTNISGNIENRHLRQEDSENVFNACNNLTNETAHHVASVKLEPRDGIEHCNEINSSDNQKSPDTNISGNVENRQLWQEESENVFNTCNSLTNETAHPATSVKLEPRDIEHCNEMNSSDANTSDNVENCRVDQEVKCDNVFNIHDSFTDKTVHQVASVKLEPIAEPHLIIDDKLNCNVSKEKQNQENLDNIQTSQPEENVNLDSEKIDSYDYNVLFTVDKDHQSEMSSDNAGRNENDGKLNNATSVKDNFYITKSTLRKTNVATQTKEDQTAEEAIESFLGKYFNQPPRSISGAISRMLKIDHCILKLTTYRQSLFNNFEGSTGVKKVKKLNQKTNNSKSANTVPNILSQKRKGNQQKNKARKKKYSDVIEGNKQEINCRSNSGMQMENRRVPSLESGNIPNVISPRSGIQKENERIESLNYENIPDMANQERGVQDESKQAESLENIPDVTKQLKLLKFEDVHEKILVLQVVEDNLVAATESGKIFFCSLEDGHYTKVMEVTKVPITSLLFIKTNQDYVQMFVGSLELYLMQFTIYKFQGHCVEKNVNIYDSVQCMESKWDYVFIGGMRGSLLRYSLKNKKMEDANKFTDNSILVLKASQEGARRILIIGSRNSPICIRDAMTGLRLRTMDTSNVVGSPTVYSLVLEKNLVYSGTTNHDILVFCFHDGKLMHRLKATDSKGISCMKIVKNLLFASCHNGSIYVYDLRYNKFVGSIEGPGGVILSMEVLEDQVIVGTMSLKFTSLPIPHDILRYTLM